MVKKKARKLTGNGKTLVAKDSPDDFSYEGKEPKVPQPERAQQQRS